MTDLPANLETALDQETFDVLDFVTGDLTPEDTVVIYTDATAGYALDRLAEAEKEQAKRGETEGLGIADELVWVDPDEVDALKAKIEASALTFKLKGLAPALKKALRANLVAKHNFKEDASFDESEGFYRDFTHELIARSIVEARTSTGKVDKTWTVEKISKLEGRIHPTEFARLDRAVFAVSSDAELFDLAVSADFLSKR